MRKTRLSLLVAAALALGFAGGVTQPAHAEPPAPLETVDCTTPLSMFNTGQDGHGSALAGGAVDLNWKVATLVPFEPSRWSGRVIAPDAADEQIAYYGATPSYSTAYVIDHRAGNQWRGANAGSQWISPFSYGFQSQNYMDFYYQLEFTLDPAVDPATFSLNMQYNADNSMLQAWVNNVPQGITSHLAPGANPYGNLSHTWGGTDNGVLSSGFKTGLNTITVLTSLEPITPDSLPPSRAQQAAPNQDFQSRSQSRQQS